MPKRKNLKGLPHNLVKSFFGTTRVSPPGYMADWLYNAARRLKVSEATIDAILPKELSLPALEWHTKMLHEIIDKELKANGFTSNFIITAKIRVVFMYTADYRRVLYCYPFMMDIEGHEYVTPYIIEEAYEPDFDPFQ